MPLCIQKSSIHTQQPARMHIFRYRDQKAKIASKRAFSIDCQHTVHFVWPILTRTVGWMRSRGTQGRDVPPRKVFIGHWDIRNADATANPYLFLAPYIGVGLLGIQNQEPLACKDSQGRSSTYSQEEREALNIRCHSDAQFRYWPP